MTTDNAASSLNPRVSCLNPHNPQDSPKFWPLRSRFLSAQYRLDVRLPRLCRPARVAARAALC